MAALEYFLARQVYAADSHSHGWSKHVYDDENIHYYLLQSLFESSPQFAQEFLALDVSPSMVACTIKPNNGLFDMLIETDNEQRYIEVKIWSELSEEQLERQVAFLKLNNANGIHLLFTKAGKKWSNDQITHLSGGLTRKVSVAKLISLLSKVTISLRDDTAEIANAYVSVLKHLEGRWPSD